MVGVFSILEELPDSLPRSRKGLSVEEVAEGAIEAPGVQGRCPNEQRRLARQHPADGAWDGGKRTSRAVRVGSKGVGGIEEALVGQGAGMRRRGNVGLRTGA